MADLLSEIDAALAGDNPIPRDTVLRWIEAAADLSALSKLYRLTDESYYRIQPELGKEVTCVLIQRYLLKCIRENVTGDDNIESRFDATQLLLQWFFHLLDMEGRQRYLKPRLVQSQSSSLLPEKMFVTRLRLAFSSTRLRRLRFVLIFRIGRLIPVSRKHGNGLWNGPGITRILLESFSAACLMMSVNSAEKSGIR